MKKRRTGFTLIELLVVVAIIAVLISILLPALSKARSLAKQTVCQADMKNFGLGLYMYIGENNSIFPYFFYTDNEPDPNKYWNTCWFNTMAPYVGMPKTLGNENLTAQERRCPADRDTWVGVNYGARVLLSAPQTYPGPFVYKILNGVTYPNVTLGGIDNPSQWVAFGDVRANHYFNSPVQWKLNYDADGDGLYDSNVSTLVSWMGEYNGAAAKVHNNGMNAIFCDGSGKWLSFKSGWEDPSLKYFKDE